VWIHDDGDVLLHLALRKTHGQGHSQGIRIPCWKIIFLGGRDAVACLIERRKEDLPTCRLSTGLLIENVGLVLDLVKVSAKVKVRLGIIN